MLSRTIYLHKVPAILRDLSWNYHIGRQHGECNCLCCEKHTITQLRHETGHIIPVSKGGKNSVENLIPICSLCNKSMQTLNFYVFKSALFGNPLIDEQKLNNIQKDVFNYYKKMSQEMSFNLYRDNFRAWFGIIEKTMKVCKSKNDIHVIECKCKYKFGYKVATIDFGLTCEGNRQNLIDVICDHAHCIIHDQAFIENTLMLPNFNTTSTTYIRQNLEEPKSQIKHPPNK